MSGWGGGYVTDIPYFTGWYAPQSPIMAALAATIGGVVAPIPTGDDAISVLELGCGYGYGAMAQAASNPNWTITAVDFNPAHIAAARSWAAEAGLTNVTFIEGDFARWEDDPDLRDLPKQDFITMHGIWSWIPPAAQDGVVRLLGAKVRPGGLVHVSYNTLPGWIDMVGPARLVREAGRRAPGRSDTQAREGLRLVRDLLEAKAHFVHGRAPVAKRLELFEKANSNYLAHEFMNENWAPCFFTDVAARMAEAKLEWAGASELPENFPELVMNEAQREICDRYDDPMMRELIKDMCTPRSLRHDVFIRGGRRTSIAERNDVLMDVSLTLTKPAADLPDGLDMPVGRAELNSAFYGPIVAALSSRSRTVRDLLALSTITGNRNNPAELIAILTGADMVAPAIRPMTAPGEEAIRFNAVTARRMALTEAPNRGVGAACRPTGIPVHTPLLALTLVDHMRRGTTGLDGLVQLIDPQGERGEEARAAVQSCLDRFIPILRLAGVC